MSELSIAELASENAELLPRRETLSTIVIKSTSIAFADDHSIAVSIDKVKHRGQLRRSQHRRAAASPPPHASSVTLAGTAFLAVPASRSSRNQPDPGTACHAISRTASYRGTRRRHRYPVPRLAPGVESLGEYQGSGLAVPPTWPAIPAARSCSCPGCCTWC